MGRTVDSGFLMTSQGEHVGGLSIARIFGTPVFEPI